MRILIVEDEVVVARRVEMLCRRILGDRLERIDTAQTFDLAAALLSENPIDVLLLDLNLVGQHGLDLIQTSAAAAFHTIIVSANTEHALRAFEFGVIDFVPKPFTQERLAQALARVTHDDGRAARPARCLAVKKLGRIELVPVADVAYIRGAHNYSELVLVDGRCELHDKSLEKLAAVLPEGFERIHKSFLVRFADIAAIHTREGSQYEAELKSGVCLPIGRTRSSGLRARLI